MTTFDALAPTYDADFTQQPIGRLLRGRVHQRLLTQFNRGQHLLEIGCGTGEDALFLAQQGLYVTATDASAEMLAITRNKARDTDAVRVAALDLSNLPDDDAQYDGVYSNFGALNCIRDWHPLAVWLAKRLPAGGKACFGVMAPYCAWEFLWHAGHWKWQIALRRLRGDEFGALHISYPTIKRITDDFASHFKRIDVVPLGLFLPTSALFDVVQMRPRLMHLLTTLEKQFEDVSALALFADHYWIEFERL